MDNMYSLSKKHLNLEYYCAALITYFMINRSKQFWTVAFFLSKYGRKVEGKITAPPVELNTSKWKDAYRMFYEALNNGRTIDAFEHSLRNARDSFDSHIGESRRVGWLTDERKPSNLISGAKSVFEAHSAIGRDEIWAEIQNLADLKIENYKREIDDLAAIQSMEIIDEKKSQTEGGVKVIVSLRYERNISLRNKAFEIHGHSCAVCDFNFADTYGEWGTGFGEVHHLVPVSESLGIKKPVNPYTDLIVLCPNCHRMVHRKRGITLTVEELKSKLKKENQQNGSA